MRKIIIASLILIFTLYISLGTAYALFYDRVFLNFSPSVGISIFKFTVTNINNKPINTLNLKPPEIIESKFKLQNEDNSLSGKIYMYIDEQEDDLCDKLDLEIYVSESLNDIGSKIYENRLDKLKGTGKKILLTDNLMIDGIIYITEKIKLSNKADHNAQNQRCSWNEIFMGESLLQAKKKPIFTYKTNIEDNSINAGTWIPPEVEVKDPDDDKNYYANKEISINWKVKSPTHDKEDLIKIDIFLYEEDGTVLLDQLADDIVNDSSFNWVIPETLAGKSKLKIKIEATDSNGLIGEDFSDESFSIKPLE